MRTTSEVTKLVEFFAAFFYALVVLLPGSKAYGFTLPENFVDVPVLEGLQDPDGFDFAPDGRMFISERITGKLRVAKYNAGSDTWQLNVTPFYTFDIPKNGNGQPEAQRSAGLRDIAFDPDFANNGFVYAFYMEDDSRHNRVVRIKASNSNPDVADAGFTEQLLIELPFNNTESSGSHNGGALEFGNDGKLYITTGDGWEGDFAGDPVQSLSSFTGKVLRINADGSIPSDNPFYNQTTGDYRAIYALGLRNPYSMSRHPDTGVLYINEARGSKKDRIYIVEAEANYQHEGSGIGNNRSPWATGADAGGELITGGAWLTENGLGNFPAIYYGRYFVALWGSNSSSTGRINTVASDSDPTSATFATGIGVVGSNNIPVKPVITRFNADGDLYYMLTTYTTSSGQIRRVRFTSQQTVATPEFNPGGGNTVDPVLVAISSATADADIRYTLDNSAVTPASILYTGPITISQSSVLRARGFKADFNSSSEASAVYIIGDPGNNQPPQVDAGDDQLVFVGQTVTLDGSGTTDPDGDDDFLTGEIWEQLAGPSVPIQDATEEIAFFTPTESGVYTFRLTVSDGIDTASDEVTISVIRAPRVNSGIQALYTFEEGSGNVITDISAVGNALNLSIMTPAAVSWLPGGGIDVTASANIISNGAGKIITACKNSNAITLESWVTPDNVDQDGPARIVSLSSDIFNRNFTLGQEDDRYDVRVRTTATDNNGVDSLTVPASTVKTELTHVVYTRDDQGNAVIYINGIPQVVGTVGGAMTNWDNGYDLLLANETSGDRAWLGRIFLVGIYCRALSAGEAEQNFAAGLPPYSDPDDTDGDGVMNMMDNCPSVANNDQANLDMDENGDACDDDRDNDGVFNGDDDDALNNKVCSDLDVDDCDDCAVGVDGFGPLPDQDVNKDGPDRDGDGLCNLGDTDDDGDGVTDEADNCPLHVNPDQADGNDNGIGDVCDPAEDLCLSVRSSNGRTVMFCL